MLLLQQPVADFMFQSDISCLFGVCLGANRKLVMFQNTVYNAMHPGWTVATHAHDPWPVTSAIHFAEG